MIQYYENDFLNNLQQSLTFCLLYNPALIITASTMKSENNDQLVNIKLLDFIHVDPTPILSIFSDQNQSRIYVSRHNYSEVYEVAFVQSQPVLQQIAQLESSLYFLSIGGVTALFKPFQVKLYQHDRWNYHSFTTQLLSIRVIGQTVYTFHEKETMVWNFSEDDFGYKYLNQSLAPYHLDADGTIVGFGKKAKGFGKIKFTICEVINNEWIIVGDEKGGLHIYDWKFLSHVKTFNQHQGPILTIKVDPTTHTVYFTGSDSKICIARLVNEVWKLGVNIRGQTHDILGLQLMGDYLISGGLTTDLCFYKLEEGQFTSQVIHKVSYCSCNRVDSYMRYILINNRNSFSIWQIGNSLARTELIVQYKMPGDKFIVDCRIYRETVEQNTYLILVVTDEDTIGWRFNTQVGLQKFITIKNQYILVQLLAKHSFIGVRLDGLIERVNCKTGKIEQIVNCEVPLPTDLKILGGGLLLVGSKISKTIKLVNTKSQQIIKEYSLNHTFTYIDQIDVDNILIQYFNDPILRKINLQTQIQTELVKLPVSIIRFAGWLNSLTKGQKQVKSKVKKYWYAASEGKMIIIPNIQRQGKKKIRTRQMDRIGQVVKPIGKQLGCNLAVIPYNFQRMIDEFETKPLFAKKIL